jgi:hypothetical protein
MKYIINALRAHFSKPVAIDTRENLVSYFWLVRFDNGVVIPYPIANQEGPDASPYEFGGIQRSWVDRLVINIQSALLHKHFNSVQHLFDLAGQPGEGGKK